MSVQKTIQQKVIVSGKGETKQHAFASALAEIQNKIMEQSNVLLRIEPVNMDILKAVENKYTERFLFFSSSHGNVLAMKSNSLLLWL